MCGIRGKFNIDNVHRAGVHAMLNAIAHRRPNDITGYLRRELQSHFFASA
jgi:asparagine synthetase B (glutamine-hydrolysing)